MGRRARAVELVLGNVIERAVSDQSNDLHKSTIIHDATLKTPFDDTSSSRPSSSIFDNCQAVNSLHPQFDTSKALKHGIAHSVMPANAMIDDDGESVDSDGRRSSYNESAISIGRMPSTTSFKPIGNITLQKFREAITQKHEVRYRSGTDPKFDSKVLKEAESPGPSRGNLKSIRFNFKTYAGEVFAAIRSALGIFTDDYVKSLANNEAFQDFVSNSKSGAFFFFTTDGKYIIKTMSHNESLWFRDFLPDYFQHLYNHPLSVLVRIVGLYRLKFNGGTRHNLHFYVMLNVFSRNESIPIHHKFDLKGSTYGREAKDSEPVMKDVDFERLNIKIDLGPHRDPFLSTLQIDADFLAKAKQMDYSLLVGIYDRLKDSPDLSEDELLLRLGYTAEEAVQPLSYDRRGILSLDNNNKIRYVYFLGIIDYLQKYNWRKKAEHFFKAIRHDGGSISAVNPTIYAHRFTSFIEKHLS